MPDRNEFPEIPEATGVSRKRAGRLSVVRIIPIVAAEMAAYSESMLGEAALLDILWTLQGKTEKEPKRGRFTRREVVDDNSCDALVAAHSRALAVLSRELAEALRMMDGGQ